MFLGSATGVWRDERNLCRLVFHVGSGKVRGDKVGTVRVVELLVMERDEGDGVLFVRVVLRSRQFELKSIMMVHE